MDNTNEQNTDRTSNSSKLDTVVRHDASDIFKQAVCHSSSISVQCEFCGRNYFDSEQAGCFEEGELEELQLMAKSEPDKYIDGDFTHWGDIDGKQVVVNCCCNALRKYEDFIWSHRHIIIDYLKDRIRENCQNAEADNESINQLDV